MRRSLLLVLSLLFALQLIAATLRCSVCGKKIQGRYLKADGKVFCSRECYGKTLPVCAACGKRCLHGAYRKDGKFYCSQKCLESTLPKCVLCGKPFSKGIIIKTPQGNKVFCQQCAALPKCFVCGEPAASGTYLKDGRFLGEKCGREAIFSESDGQKIFAEVRELMRSKLNLGTRHCIHFQLVDLNTLKKASQNYEPGMEMGLFKHSYTINTRTETTYSLFEGKREKTEKRLTNNRYAIMLLDGLPEWKFVEVCAHELGHDYMDEYFPKIRDLKIKEGWAEYVAAMVNSLCKRDYLNKRMEENPSKVYGDGYRFISDYVRQHGLDGLMQYFHRLNN
ncbi:MAG: LIM domain-containing protein [Victivallales bacterium]|nr:LIM domain-containing protein [Victivallales bacterium]